MAAGIWKRIWNDPVWSKVISVAIVGAAAAIGSYLLNWWPTIGGFLVDVFAIVPENKARRFVQQKLRTGAWTKPNAA